MKSLDRKKSRSDTGLFLAEGPRLIEEALEHGWEPLYALAGTAALERARSLELLGRLNECGARVNTTTEKILGAVSRKDNPQTILAAFRSRARTLNDLATDGSRRWIALYEVRDPGNLGTIIRTADSSGVDGVILVGTCCDLFSPETVRASMGSLFAMPVAMADTQQLLAWVGETRAQVIAASMRAEVRHDAVEYEDKTVVLMGNEQSGIPEELERQCDTLVRIPMSGSADSLNLACATAIMTYEVWRAKAYEGAEPG